MDGSFHTAISVFVKAQRVPCIDLVSSSRRNICRNSLELVRNFDTRLAFPRRLSFHHQLSIKLKELNSWTLHSTQIIIVMPRSRGGSGGRSSRPAPAPKRPTVTPPQQPSRGAPASTAAHPPATTQQAGPPAQQGRSPGLLGQMASTAA